MHTHAGVYAECRRHACREFSGNYLALGGEKFYWRHLRAAGIIFDSSPLQNERGREREKEREREIAAASDAAAQGCAIRAIAIAITLDPHAIKLSSAISRPRERLDERGLFGATSTENLVNRSPGRNWQLNSS